MKFIHILNFYQSTDIADLIQLRTLESIGKAQEIARMSGIQVDLLITGNGADIDYAKILCKRAGLRTSPAFCTSSYSTSAYPFLHGRACPEINDVFFGPNIDNAIKNISPDDNNLYILISNADICLRPHLYVSIQAIFSIQGNACMVINRETLPYDLLLEDVSCAYNQRGKKHPGHDFFCLPKSLYSNLQLKSHVVGFGFVMRPVLANMLFSDLTFIELCDSRLTFHYGDDMEWKNEKWTDAIQFNKVNMKSVFESLYHQRWQKIGADKQNLIKKFFTKGLIDRAL